MTTNRGRRANDLIALQAEAIHSLTQESIRLAGRSQWVPLLQVAAVFAVAALVVVLWPT
ncbi:hypothetical protein MNO14_13745 [Luteimonas sp. S4-F44]|uniref:hypothetical protein n=1 Tax=Luteimonas sp. S4-F44 TaxID=2925842 RepID=UPI001F52FA9C|nr:hypothetical protein [Luteimonas sp. S4-F44]UNK42002.1 hypothetical protein MNO14_13745 [Luteimonas sp. S4-F44]